MPDEIPENYADSKKCASNSVNELSETYHFNAKAPL
jgi:hypothetical protein